MKDFIKNIAQKDERCLVMRHYADHAGLIYFDTASSSCMLYLINFEELSKQHEHLLSNVDLIMIYDSCYSGLATRGFESIGRSVEVLFAVDVAQKALGNFTDVARTQNIKFIVRLATEVARRVGRGDTAISFAQVIGELRNSSQSELMPAYTLESGNVGIRISLRMTKEPPRPSSIGHQSGSFESSVATSSSSASRATVIFKVRLKECSPDDDGPEVSKLVEWLHTLHPNLGLELSGINESGSIILLMEGLWPLWVELRGLSGFEIMADTFGDNRLSEILSRQHQNRPRSAPESSS
jgi:hypothetical protein